MKAIAVGMILLSAFLIGSPTGLTPLRGAENSQTGSAAPQGRRLAPEPLHGMDDIPHIRDIKPPPGPRLAHFYPAFMTMAGSLLVAGGVFAYHLARRQKKKTAGLTPYEKAMEAILALNTGKLFPEKSFDCSPELSDILRSYLEKAFGLGTAAMTTEEFLCKAESSPVIPDSHKTALRDFLRYCDQVKFAGHESSPEERKHSFQIAKTIIELTNGLSRS